MLARLVSIFGLFTAFVGAPQPLAAQDFITVFATALERIAFAGLSLSAMNCSQRLECQTGRGHDMGMLVAFKGTLIDRGRGTGAKRIMDAHPKRGEFIQRLTGWEQVEPGTLTLDHAVPLPLPALRDVSPLGEEPDDLLLNLNASDAQIAKKRGSPKYYGAVASARSGRRRVVLSQQPRPAVGHRLEIIGNVFLRTALQVVTGDIIHIEIFNADDWRQLPADLI